MRKLEAVFWVFLLHRLEFCVHTSDKSLEGDWLQLRRLNTCHFPGVWIEPRQTSESFRGESVV